MQNPTQAQATANPDVQAVQPSSPPQTAEPAVPPAPQPSRVTVTTSEGGKTIAIATPEAMTVEDVRGLEAVRSELNDQLREAQQRRREVASELNGADPLARPGIEQRLKVLDDRIVQIENRITETGQVLTSMPAGLAMAAQRQERMERAAADNDEDEMFFVGSFVSAGLIFLILGIRRIRARGRRKEPEPIGGVGSDRFMRLEQAVDAIAVEVERISEGQRFTAKLMADSAERVRREPVPRDPGSAY